MKQKRILASLLAALLLTSTVTGCGSDTVTDTTNADNTAIPTDTVETETERVLWQDLSKTDLGGYDFRIIEYTPAAETGANMLHGDAEELTGEVVNDAIYNRNIAVEDTFNCVISTEGVNWGQAASALEKSVTAGDDNYSLGMDTPGTISPLMMKNVLLNLYTVPNMELSNPWYNQKQVESFTVQDKLFFFMGDLSFSTLMFGACMIYNLDLADRLGLEYIYDVVMEHQWTLDKMYEMTEGVSQDLNGDGEFKEADDQFAYAMRDSGNMMNFMFSSDTNFIEYDTATNTFVNTFDLEKVSSIVEKMNKNYNDGHRGIDSEDHTKLFQECRVLMRSAYVGGLVNHQDMEDAFAPIPYPLYDTEQPEYLSMMTGSVQVMAIPTTVTDPAAVGLIIEAMSEHSHGELNDAVYERVLSYQTMRSEDAMDILKLIHESLIVDFGYLTALGQADNMKWVVGNLVMKNSTDVASYYAKYKDALESFYADMLEDFTNLG